MRIISGSAGGITIKVPALVARPTTDQVREAVFSMLGEVVEGARVLDIFAGSGAYGLECLSRGAQAATFVEQNGKACGIIQENLNRARLSNGRVVKSEAKTELRRLVKAGAQFDLIFADPPYAKQPGDPDHARDLLAGEDLRAVLAPGGWLIVESMVTKRADPAMPQWTVVRDRSYGSTRVLLLQSSLSHCPNDAETSGAPDLQSSLSSRPGGHAAESYSKDAAAGRPVD